MLVLSEWPANGAELAPFAPQQMPEPTLLWLTKKLTARTQSR